MQRILPPTKDHDKIKAAIERLKPGGSTAMFDAVLQVIRDMKPVSGRKAILLFSDGQDVRSLATLASVAAAARGSDVIIYAIGTIENNETEGGRRDLTELSESSGGESFFVTRLSELKNVFERVEADLRSQYVLSFVPPPAEAGLRQIEVRVKNPALVVRCRKSYWHGGAS